MHVGRLDLDSVSGASVEIDLGDLERDDALDLLVSEEVVDEPSVSEPVSTVSTVSTVEECLVASEYEEMDALLASGRDFANEFTLRPKRNWLRRAFACGFFFAAFWLAHAQLAPWLD